MKLTLQLLVAAFLVNINVSCGQRIVSIKTIPDPLLLKPYKKGGDPANGSREIKILLSLSKPPKTDLKCKFSVDQGSTLSKPRLLDTIIRISKRTVKNKQVELKLKLKLKELDCLTSAETFKISTTALWRNDNNSVISNPVGIEPTEIPAKPSILLAEETTVIKPYLKSGNQADSLQIVLLTLVLEGKQTDVGTDTIIKVVLPIRVKTPSDPVIVNSYEIRINRDSFNVNGCPKIIKLPVLIRLSAIEKSTGTEKIYLAIAKNGITDNAHIHTVNVEPQPAGKSTPTVTTPPDGKKKKYSFSHSCISGKNFLITLQPDSSTGGSILVSEEKDTAVYTYHYYQFFHTADFTNWLLNIFKTQINRLPCNDCATCAAYLAERAYEELNKLKETPVAAASKGTEKNNSEKEGDKPKAAADSVKAPAPAVPDTFRYHLSYADSIFALSITKDKDLTVLELCKDPKTTDTDCRTERIVEADEKTFNDRVAAMIQKLSGAESVDPAGIKPANIYTKYKKEEAAKQVKEKSAELKSIEGRLAALENEKITYTDVGIISLRDTSGKITIHKNDGSLVETEIDSVTLVIKDGQLMRKQLLIKTKKGSFWNDDSPVAVNRINERGYDKLRSKSIPFNDRHVVLGEVLEYVGDGYVPDDTIIVLTPKASYKKLSATSNLNSLINFAIYTDLAGLLGRRANGIINTDVSGRFITNTRNWPTNIDISPLAFIEANFVLSKFDSKFKSIDSSSIKLGIGGQKDTIDRMQLMQTAWFKGSVKLNLFTWRFFYYQSLSVNAGTRINVVNADSLFRKERDIIFFDYFGEAVYSINKLRNFGMDLSLRWIRQRVADKEPFANRGGEWIFNPQIDFSYYPVDNRNSRVYLRFNYFANRDKQANNFYQLQFGIKSDLKFGSKK